MKLNPCSLLLFLMIFYVFSACNSKKGLETVIENTDSTAAISGSRAQIKAFWELYRLAQKFRVEGNWIEAAKNYEKALEINPGHEDSWFNLGNVYLELNQGKKAEACWLNIVVRNPNSARAHMQLGRLYLSFERPQSFDLEKAEQEFVTSASINTVITGPMMQLGYVALFKGKNEEAKTFFQDITGTDTKSVEPHLLLGYLVWVKGDFSIAQQHFEKAISLAVANKKTKGTLSEGDTKDGASHLRPINESIFHEYFKNLSDTDMENISNEMNKLYQNLDFKLSKVKKQINSLTPEVTFSPLPQQ